MVGGALSLAIATPVWLSARARACSRPARLGRCAMTIFERIAAREIPADIVYEDESVLAFRDIHPQAPVHVLLIPKRVIRRIGEAQATDASLLGHLLTVVPEVARRVGVAESGYRLVINNGRDGGESVPHLHCHLLGGRSLAWPPG